MNITSASSRFAGRRLLRRGLGAVTVGALAASTGVGAAAIPAGASTPIRWCLVTPAPDTQPFGAYLVGMYRFVGDEMQVLHRVDCSDHTVSYRWITADFG